MFEKIGVAKFGQCSRVTRIQRQLSLKLFTRITYLEVFPQHMAQTVMQIGNGRLKSNRGAIFLDGFAVVSFCFIQIRDNLVHAIRAGVCVVELEISLSAKVFVATRSSVETLDKVSHGFEDSFTS